VCKIMAYYVRQSSLDLIIPESISVIGCGGVGTWIALSSAMMGVKEITLFDDDKLEASNLNRLPYTSRDLGEYKVNLLRELILKVRPEAQVIAYPIRVSRTTSKLLEGVEVAFDTTDSTRAHRLIERIWNNGRGFWNLVRASYDGDHITIAKNIPIESRSWGEEGVGYTIVPSWVAPTLIVAQLACYVAYSRDAPHRVFISTSINEIVEATRREYSW